MYYRLYLMRGEHFRDAIEIHAADDASALKKAEDTKDEELRAQGETHEGWEDVLVRIR